MTHEHGNVSLLLRVALAFAFLYPPVAAIADPVAWISYFPPFLLDSGIPPFVLLHGFGVVEVALALWLLFPHIPRRALGLDVEYPAFAAAAILLAIVAFNWAQLDVLFRDVSLAAAAFALGLLHLDQ